MWQGGKRGAQKVKARKKCRASILRRRNAEEAATLIEQRTNMEDLGPRHRPPGRNVENTPGEWTRRQREKRRLWNQDRVEESALHSLTVSMGMERRGCWEICSGDSSQEVLCG